MIEIIYNESEKAGSSVVVKPPKNIRQIGNAGGRHKIYVEDYVYTFLHTMDYQGTTQKQGAILLGQSEVFQDIRYTFINGAIRCDEFIFRENSIQFDEKCWEHIYKEIKQYFDQEKILGWSLGMSGFSLELTPMVEAAHRKYFSGRDKVLLMSELAEKEDVFYVYEQGVLQKKEGYYIYYEKNPNMQEYMIYNRKQIRKQQLTKNAETDCLETINSKEINPEIQTEHTQAEHTQTEHTQTEYAQSGTSAEQAIQKYRKMLLEKKEVQAPVKKNTLLYTASAVAMIVLCILGITTMNNYEKMKQVEETLMIISEKPLEETVSEEQEIQENQEIIVESVPGEIEPETTDSVSKAGKDDKVKEDAIATSEEKTKENNAEKDQDAVQEKSTTKEQNTTQNQETIQTETTSQDKEAIQDKDTTQEKEVSQEKDTVQEENATDKTDSTEETLAQTFLEQGYYEVQPGDKLELICMKIYRTTAMMDKLCEVNQIDDVDKIYAGQKLILP